MHFGTAGAARGQTDQKPVYVSDDEVATVFLFGQTNKWV